MASSLLEAGKIVGAHGVRGEVRILSWTDTPGFLAGFKRLYISGVPVRVLSSRVHKGCIIAALEGVTGIEGATKLRNSVVSIARGDALLDESRHFIADLVGLRAVDAATGETLGIVADVLTLPANNVYVIKGAREILIPAVPDFIGEVSIDGGYIKFRLIEGM